MPQFRALTGRYRFPQVTALLEGSLGLDGLQWSAVDKRVANLRLGLPPACPVAMTIGAESYFMPSGNADFLPRLADCWHAGWVSSIAVRQRTEADYLLCASFTYSTATRSHVRRGNCRPPRALSPTSILLWHPGHIRCGCALRSGGFRRPAVSLPMHARLRQGTSPSVRPRPMWRVILHVQ
jgi:hypothetical protein